MARKPLNKVSEEKSEVKQEVKQERVKLDDHLEVRVANNINGVLVYKSPRTQQDWVFQSYGDEDIMELHELRTMKSNHPAFFRNGWIRILDEEVIKYLRLERFYDNVITPEELDELFDLSVEEIQEILDKANENAKSLIVGKAKEKYQHGELTNVHVIKLIEDKFKIKLDVS